MKPTRPTETKTAPLAGVRFLKPDELFTLLGYRSRAEGWRAVKRAGVPFIRVNARKALFDEREVAAWLAARTVGTRRAS